MPSSSSTRPERRAGIGRLLVLGLLLLLGAGCRVTTTVGVDIDGGGGGQVVVEVVLDKDAARRVGDIRSQIRTADLESAGWVVEGPEALDDGGARLRVRHSFATPAEGEAIFRSLATSESPFGSVRVTQHRGFWSTSTAFTATVDLSGGLAALSDPELAGALGGQALGVPIEDLEGRLGAALDRVFRLQVAVRLPGNVDSNAPERFDGGARWTPKLGERVTLEASSTALNRPRIVLTVLAILSALGAIALGGGIAVRRRTGLPSALRPAAATDDGGSSASAEPAEPSGRDARPD